MFMLAAAAFSAVAVGKQFPLTVKPLVGTLITSPPFTLNEISPTSLIQTPSLFLISASMWAIGAGVVIGGRVVPGAVVGAAVVGGAVVGAAVVGGAVVGAAVVGGAVVGGAVVGAAVVGGAVVGGTVVGAAVVGGAVV